MLLKEPSVRYSPHGRGYILLWRKALSSAAFQDPVTWKIFCWCLLRANYEPLPWDATGEEIKIERGQFVTGRFSAAKELKLHESTIYRNLKKLEKFGAISLKSNNKYTVVTICNYESYQDPSFSIEQPANNQRTTSEQPANTNKETNKPINQETSLCTEVFSLEEKIDIEKHLLTHWGRDGKQGHGVMIRFCDLIKKHGRSKVLEGIEIAGRYNKKSLAYVIGILEPRDPESDKKKQMEELNRMNEERLRKKNGTQ
jgi:hypothetical protein